LKGQAKGIRLKAWEIGERRKAKGRTQSDYEIGESVSHPGNTKGEEGIYGKCG